MNDELTLTARWIFPVSSAPLERGTITVRGGAIASIEPRGNRTADLDLDNAAIIPGLVNAHTHLDLSGLRGQVPPGPEFIGWLKAIIAHRRQQTPEQIEGAIRDGLAETLHYGTTLIGDITGGGQSWPILAGAPCRSVAFYEILGLHRQRVIPVWKEAARWLDEHQDDEHCRAGLSPHAPYSVHQALFRAAGMARVPLAIHLAETLEEAELLDEHRGPFADFLKEVGVWDEDGLAPSTDWITWRGERAPALALAHGNYLDPKRRLPANATIVYCPRTHAAFGHGPHPFREFLHQGVRVALGTDSLASNPDLDVLAEARFVHEQYPDLPLDQLLRMATLAGAEALGYADVTGSLEAGKSADAVVLALPPSDLADPHQLLFGATSFVHRTLWRGSWRNDGQGRGPANRWDGVNE